MDDALRKQIFQEFKDMITTESVIGQPIYLGDATIVPFVDVSFGFGSGQTGADGQTTGGAGGGKMTPTAVLILKGERVELFSIKNAATTGTIDKLLNLVPDVVSRFRKKENKEDGETAKEGTAPDSQAPASEEKEAAQPEKNTEAAQEKDSTAPDSAKAEQAPAETSKTEEP